MQPESARHGIRFQVTRDDQGDILLVGSVRVKEGEEFNRGDNLLAAIVMVVTTPISYLSTNPLQETMVFEDDLFYEDGDIGGRFTVNFSSIIAPMPDRQFNILMSIGRYQSGIETVVLQQAR